MLDILTYLPHKRKSTGSGWISFNAPCCVHNGESADRRQRGGIKITDQDWSYHCFNCGFKTSFTLGRAVSLKTKRFLSWIGVPEDQISYLNLESLKARTVQDFITDRERVANTLSSVTFEDRELPKSTVLVNSADFPEHYDYLRNRKVPLDYPFMTSVAEDNTPWLRTNIIIPCTYDNHMVGHVYRFLDNRIPKYINQIPPGYVFGVDLLKPSWQYVIVTEGIFDALSISGLAVMHNTINDRQAQLIRNLGKEVIVVPDQDKAGLELVDRAVELGWSVSIPPWAPYIKDVNDAVCHYGKLTTVLSIFENRVSGSIKIKLQRKNLEAKIKLTKTKND